MKLNNKWKYHLLIIVLVIAMNFFSKYVYYGTEGFLETFQYPHFFYFLVFNAIYVIIYFLNFYIVCPKTLKENKIFKFIVAVFLMLALFAALRYFFEEIVLYQITGEHNYSDNARSRIGYYFFDNTYYALKPILFSAILYLMFRFFENKNKIHQLEIDHKKAEVAYLKSQISPHFLFNTLNAFYVELLDDKPETAKDIHKLSELLRFVTYESQEELVALKNEIKFLEDYVYFYYKRFEDQLFVDFKVEGLISIQQIPSLILIHFVENVFKHGIINDKNNKALIHINITENFIELTTKNKFMVSEKYTSKGIGKSNIERRLKAIYKTNFTLNYSDQNEYFTSYVKIPF